jgi:hypothetical protein
MHFWCLYYEYIRYIFFFFLALDHEFNQLWKWDRDGQKIENHCSVGTDIKYYTWLSSDQSDCVFPSEEVPVHLWILWCRKTVLLTIRFFDVTNFTTLTPLSSLVSCKLSSPVVALKIFSLPTFALNSPNYIVMWHRIYRIYTLVPHKSCHFYHHFHPKLVHAHSEQ